jgi:hypothetical protein
MDTRSEQNKGVKPVGRVERNSPPYSIEAPTMNLYGHVLDETHRDATNKLDALLGTDEEDETEDMDEEDDTEDDEEENE